MTLIPGTGLAARPQGDPARPTAGVDVSLKAGGSSYTAHGQGTCTHAPKASIYGVLSEMWSVRHQEQGRSVQLTFWKPTDGSSSMFSLSVNGKTRASVSTVRGKNVSGSATPSGSGSVTFAPAGKGGTFTIDAKAATGEPITGTIRCDAFAAAVAEGGD
jgi:hypothetical protein